MRESERLIERESFEKKTTHTQNFKVKVNTDFFQITKRKMMQFN